MMQCQYLLSIALSKNSCKKNSTAKNASALILGATFKENCPDLRNSKVVDVYQELKEFGFRVDVFDPEADEATFRRGIWCR